MNHQRLSPSALLLAAVIMAPWSAFAADEVNVSHGLTGAGAPLALHGYDPVAYFTQAKPVRGSHEFTHIHEGAAYRFASQQNLVRFQSDPERYAPQYGGYCAFGVSVGKKFDGDPRMWTIHNDRLYLNLNPDIQATFAQDVPGNIKKAASNWKKIEHSRVSDL